MLTHVLQGDPMHLLAHEVPMALLLAWGLLRRQRRGAPCYHCEVRERMRPPMPPRRFPFVDLGQPWLCPFCAGQLAPVDPDCSALMCPECGAREIGRTGFLRGAGSDIRQLGIATGR